MPREKYQAGIKYSNGPRTIVFRYENGGKMYFNENGERKSMHRQSFYLLKFEPLEPISTGRIKAKPSMPKDHYKKGNSLLYRLKEE